MVVKKRLDAIGVRPLYTVVLACNGRKYKGIGGRLKRAYTLQASFERNRWKSLFSPLRAGFLFFALRSQAIRAGNKKGAPADESAFLLLAQRRW